jgi:poly(A) polymerase
MTSKQAAEQVIRALGKAGFEAYLVGGCVRDLVLGREPKDYDVTTNARPEQVIKVFDNSGTIFPEEVSDKFHQSRKPFGGHEVRTVPIGAAFGVVTVVLDGVNTEVATYRSDGEYEDGRHPEIVFYSDTAEQDVSRRDFTMNGLLVSCGGTTLAEGHPGSGPQSTSFAIQPAPGGEGLIVDYVGGLRDIRDRLVRCIGSPAQRFTEDALRMLRACRFAAQLGFQVEQGTLDAIRRNAPLIRGVSVERITAELLRLVTSPNAAGGLFALAATGLLDYLPISEAVKPSLANAMRRLAAFPTTDQDLGMAMLLAGYDPCETDSEGLCKALRMSSEHTKAICGALSVRIDLLINGSFYYYPQNHSRYRLKRLMRTPGAMNGVALARQDVLLRREHEEEGEEAGPAREDRGAALRYTEVLDYCTSLTPGEIRPERLATGDDLIAMGMEPGRGFRIILEAIEDMQLEGRISTREEALEAMERMRRGVEYVFPSQLVQPLLAVLPEEEK